MKKSFLLVMLLILICICNTMFAQIPVVVGNETQTNSEFGAPAPYGTWYKAFRQQFLVRAIELNYAGGGAGNITSLAFNVGVLNNVTPMNNYRIRLKHTTQNALTSTFETGDYQEVFQANSITPSAGWNTHNFATPFVWDGTSNLLVDIVTDIIAGEYAENPSVFYTNTSFNSSLRFQSDTANGAAGTNGTASMKRSNMRFMMQQLDILDMAAVEISGPLEPIVNQPSNYIVTVKSLCLAPVGNYTVKLMMAPDIVLASVPGTSINFLQELNFTIPWEPADAGPAQIYGHVELPGDENPDNDNTDPLSIAIQSDGIMSVTIGSGIQEDRIPMDFYHKTSIYQCIFFANELGFSSGTISAMQLYNNFETDMPNGAAQIWLGNTYRPNLSGSPISAEEMTLVFDGEIEFPSGENEILIPFTTPFVHIPGNLVMMILRPMDDVTYNYLDYFKCQTSGNNRARNGYDDSNHFDPIAPPLGYLSGKYPKTTFFYLFGQTIENDLSCISINGNNSPNVNSSTPYTVRIRNNGTNTQNNYQVKLFHEDGSEIASVNGPTINSLDTADVVVNWAPTLIGPTSIYAKVVLTGDETPENDQTTLLEIDVIEAGLTIAQVGTGTSVNTSTSAPAPYGTWIRSFREQYLYKADEIIAVGGAPGLISSIAFNVQNVGQCTPMINYTIRLKHTTQGALSNNFEAGEYQTVYQASTFMPVNGWNRHVFSQPFVWNGNDNLLVEVVTDLCQGSYNANAQVYYSTLSFYGSLRYEDDYQDAIWGTTGIASQNRTNIRLFMVVDDLGSMSGTVTSSGAPLAGATVRVNDTVFNTTSAADGTYSLPYVLAGTHTVTASKHGYADTPHTVTIVQDQNTVQNFVLNQLPQVTVTGRIVGSVAPSIGVADASISLSGYEPYSATTNAQGQFTIPNVYASNTYQYVVRANGYQPATGQAVVGTTNLNMGDVMINEVAFPPYQAVANESEDFSHVNLTWQTPDPNAVEITEGFEYEQFPPEGWSQIINNQNPGSVSVLPTWCRRETINLDTPVSPPSGEWQAAIWWDTSPQDEWLITPQFVCPPNAVLTFWTSVFLGSIYGDHYYVKASTDGGNTWTALWDASALTGGWNYYDAPISVPLDIFAWQNVKLAFQALGPPGDGLWYIWLLDDIRIGSSQTVIRFPISQLTARNASANNQGFETNTFVQDRPASRAMVDNPNLQEPRLNVASVQNDGRALVGYKIWRLLETDQGNENNWVSLTPSIITTTSFTDTAWEPLPAGVYKYAVKAIYTSNVISIPAFSNSIHKDMMGTLTGTITEFGTDLSIEGATITAGLYSGVSNAQGQYSFHVFAGTYNVVFSKAGYQAAIQNNVVITGLQTTTLNFVLTEITLPARAVHAEIVDNNVSITWTEPGTTFGEWLHYDSGENYVSVGTDTPIVFDVAIRFPESALLNHVGTSLHAVKVWPAQPGTFKVRVWTGGTPNDPGQMVVDQLFAPVLDTYNTVILDNPVYITGNEELWFGYNCDVTGGLPAGCDEGPAINGFGNMIFFQGEWGTLLHFSPTLDYNWNIQGYVGYQAPTNAPLITPISHKSAYPSEHSNQEMSRLLAGYKVWRMHQGQEENENAWVSLTPNAISATNYLDTGWNTVTDGSYRWAVKVEYTGGALSMPALSNAVTKVTQFGTIAGVVRNVQNAPVSGATIRCGTITTTTSANGAYTMQIVVGTYSVTVSHPNYAPATVSNVIVTTGQTTTLNFQLQPSVTVYEDGFEIYENFSIDFAPWTNVDIDGSGTYGMTNVDWPNNYDPQAFIIFVPSATTPPSTNVTPHGGIKLAACFAATSSPNDDWLITPPITGAGAIKFWARSFTAQYGLERFKVGVSTTGTEPDDFTIISGNTYIEAPEAWTEYTYDLSAFEAPVYIGFNCVSNDAFFFLLDDVKITGATDTDDPLAPSPITKLNANFPNPFNPETTISFSLQQASPVTIEIYNVKGQLVKALVKDTRAAGNHSVVWDGKDNNNRNVSSGIYYYKMTAGTYNSTRKMILMK